MLAYPLSSNVYIKQLCFGPICHWAWWAGFTPFWFKSFQMQISSTVIRVYMWCDLTKSNVFCCEATTLMTEQSGTHLRKQFSHNIKWRREDSPNLAWLSWWTLYMCEFEKKIKSSASRVIRIPPDRPVHTGRRGKETTPLDAWWANCENLREVPWHYLGSCTQHQPC